MKFTSQKNKLAVTFLQTTKNQNSLDEKTVIYKSLEARSKITKLPRILYDSDWIVPGVLDGNVIAGNQNIYFAYVSTTDKLAQQTPLELDYTFAIKLNIPESWLPFIEPIIMIDNFPNVTIEGVMPFQRYEYRDNYWKFYGDLTKIYEGISPSKTQFTDEERALGNFSTSLASKWYYGTTEYTIGADSYAMENGYVVSIKTYYDVVELGGHPGAYSYKMFECKAIDSISESSITGTGTYTTVVLTDDGFGGISTITTITRNVTMSAPMFEDSTSLYLSGSRLKNGVFQRYYLDTNPYLVSVQGIMGGTATLNSFVYDWVSNSDYKFWKLFYDNKRAKQFIFNTSTRLLYNLPTIIDYQTETLPYTNIKIDENLLSIHPIIQQDETASYYYSYDKKMWNKLNDNQFIFRCEGVIILSSSALKVSTTTVEFLQEQYSQVGNTYIRDNANRIVQDRPLYFPLEAGNKLRLILSFSNPLNDNSIQNYKVK